MRHVVRLGLQLLPVQEHGHPLLPQRLGHQVGPRVRATVLPRPLAVVHHILRHVQDLHQHVLAHGVVLALLLLLFLVPHRLVLLTLGLGLPEVFLTLPLRKFVLALHFLLVVSLPSQRVLLFPLGAVADDYILPLRLLAQVLGNCSLLLRYSEQLLQHDVLAPLLIDLAVRALLVKQHLAPPFLPLLPGFCVLYLALLDLLHVVLAVRLCFRQRLLRPLRQFLQMLERDLVLGGDHFLQGLASLLSVLSGRILCTLRLSIQSHAG
mmetsp:Transcript_29091/g.49604  ORF Transcript_29091/g.49604 Transcript_29091/m.49604 type:complete len:265 (+) Transcript_29091:3819-4613(+)